MRNAEKFELWLDTVCQRPLPQNRMAQIRILAKELAEGASNKLWGVQIDLQPSRVSGGEYIPLSDFLRKYLFQRWNTEELDSGLLHSNGYLEGHKIVKAAFDLLDETEPASIFISYRRKDSSAFALLILKHLKEHGLDPFVDMALVPGEDWHAGLKERIQSYDFLILVLGKETLSSKYVLDEVDWAMDAGLTIIPVWHNDFEYKSADWGNIPVKIDKMLQSTHAIRVREESALDYNTAIVELLNRFGVTP